MPHPDRLLSQPADLSVSEILLDESIFVNMLRVERKRTERSGRRFVLMLVESAHLLKTTNTPAIEKVLNVLARTTRETDIKGWYKNGAVLGVIFTEIDPTQGRAVANALLTRLMNALCSALSIEDINEIHLSFHVYPEEPPTGGNGTSGSPADLHLYPDETTKPPSNNGGSGTNDRRRKPSRWAKRLLDILGSLFGLVILSPLMIAIAIAVKLTSRGPVLFKQQRVGIYGRRFSFLKFRSMYTGNDDSVHREYVKAFIAQSPIPVSGVFKLTNDARITPLGRYLRKSSLDELPQLFNVLSGEMSLVGPRPAVPYEVENYGAWHRRRVLAVKPGITGLWQVAGRSRVTFDEMVRLDLRYAASWNFWLDIKILLHTPRAVIAGSGAY